MPRHAIRHALDTYRHPAPDVAFALVIGGLAVLSAVLLILAHHHKESVL